MTDWSYETCEPALEGRASLTRKVFVRTIPVLAAFSFSAAVALRLAGGLAGEAGAPVGEAAAPAPFAASAEGADRAQGSLAQSTAAAVAHVALESGPSKPNLDKPRNPFGGLFDPDGAVTGMPAMAAKTDPVGPSFSPLQSEPLFVLVETPDTDAPQVAETDTAAQAIQQVAQAEQGRPLVDIPVPPLRSAEAEEVVSAPSVVQNDAPLPPARPSELTNMARAEPDAAPRRDAVQASAAPTAPASTPAAPPTRTAAATARERAQATTFARNDPRSFFDKLFSGNPDQKGPQLAYASPDAGGGLFNFPRPSASPAPIVATGGTAVYDISAHTVYLPNGTALEAHSGLGPYFDNPGSVHIRMRGATPPATYQLTLRESLFHGVQALRLTPLDSAVHGRNGLLAHTFMLGPRGESNGCVSFRNYRAFLEAYMRGEIRNLKVVASR